ncbi:MAG: hypothetical protein L6E13_11370 [Firmicutes bacterium]|nr:hypothetical protein [Bacillota bacterium]
MSENKDLQHLPPPITGGQEEPVCILAPTVSGLGETEVLERIVIDLAELVLAAVTAGLLPAGTTSVVEAVTLVKRVTVTECEVFTNKVLLNGILHKDLLLKVGAETPLDLSDTLLTANDCTVQPVATLDLVIDCPFGACITVPGACPGDRCEVELACVDAERDLLIDTNGDGVADQLEEKVCILLRVKTIRNQQITVQPVTNICPEFTPQPTCPPPSPCLQFLPSSTFVSR